MNSNVKRSNAFRLIETFVAVVVFAIVGVGILAYRTGPVQTPAATASPDVRGTNVGAVGSPEAVEPISSPLPAPSVAPGFCSQVRWQYERATNATKALAQAAAAVVIAKVRDIGEAQWVTSDGRQPNGLLSAFAVFRVVHVDVTDVGRGSVMKGATIAVRVPGGRISTPNGPTSCADISIEGSADFAKGSDVALFLAAKGSVQKGPTAGADFDAQQAWQVVAGSVVQPDNAEVSVSVFLADAAP